MYGKKFPLVIAVLFWLCLICFCTGLLGLGGCSYSPVKPREPEYLGCTGYCPIVELREV